MLRELHIRNFAIIDNQSVSFGEGLNVISGETGAGKSIVLNAVELVLGARPKPHSVRSGAESLEVSALFDLTGLSPAMFESLPDVARGDELVVTRSINNQGKGKVYINGKLSTVGMIEEIVTKIVNICGQNQHVRLLDPKYHLDVIDAFADNAELLAACADAFHTWATLDAELTERKDKSARRAIRQAEIEFLLEELAAVELRPGIRAELEAQLRSLDHGERILETGRGVQEMLTENDGAITILTKCLSELQGVARLDPQAEALVRQAEKAKELIFELDDSLLKYCKAIDIDEEKLGALRDHLAEVARLERKFKTNDEGLCLLRDKAKLELQELGDEQSLAALEKAAGVAKAKTEGLAETLSDRRHKAATRIAKTVSGELAELNMKGCKLAADFSKKDLGVNGHDRLELLISPNPGEDPKPLRQIASGGELSRITLVLKKVLRERSGVNVLVFDEVDSGISGAVARAVGEKLQALSKDSQVICITHLPQVASLADRHFVVEKVQGKRTNSHIREVSGEEKVEEIARMLAGYDITKAARESARELLSSNMK